MRICCVTVITCGNAQQRGSFSFNWHGACWVWNTQSGDLSDPDIYFCSGLHSGFPDQALWEDRPSSWLHYFVNERKKLFFFFSLTPDFKSCQCQRLPAEFWLRPDPQRTKASVPHKGLFSFFRRVTEHGTIKHETGNRWEETLRLQGEALLPGLERRVFHLGRLLQPLARRGCASKEAERWT